MEKFRVAYDLVWKIGGKPGETVPRGWPGGMTSAGWTVAEFDTLEEAQAFADITTIYGRREGNRIGHSSLRQRPAKWICEQMKVCRCEWCEAERRAA